MSLHPFHSTRRIYLAIAKLLKLKIGSFYLEILDSGQELDIPFWKIPYGDKENEAFADALSELVSEVDLDGELSKIDLVALSTKKMFIPEF